MRKPKAASIVGPPVWTLRTIFILGYWLEEDKRARASMLRTWKNALLIVQPDTLLRWHRESFRIFWRRKSRAASREPKAPMETIELIQRMAVENRLWGLSG